VAQGQGFDPEGDLCVAVASRFGPTIKMAMFRAAEAGQLGVCHFLWEHGAASTINMKGYDGNTLMFVACRFGNLEVAKWLFEVG
jgi:hypothetical protein